MNSKRPENIERSPERYLRLGILQTTTDAVAAYRNGPPMTRSEADHAWKEVTEGLRSFYELDERPHFILLPELALPVGRKKGLISLCKKVGSRIISGTDYALDRKAQTVKNLALVVVPQRWPEYRSSRRCSLFYFGKTYAPAVEKEKLDRSGYEFQPDHTIWLFDAGVFGRIGVCICYDFMDVERYIMYRGEVQHLFVLAYNRDIQSFYHLAETLARTVFCNVAVCNTGFHGGSVVVSPYYKPNRRTLYRHEGKSLYTSQVVQLPVVDLMQAQNGKDPGELDEDGKSARLFKSLPPGYRSRATLRCDSVRLNDSGEQS